MAIVCDIFNKCTNLFRYQLIQEAEVPEVTSSGLWHHFKAVTIPAIQLWQTEQEEGSTVPTISEVVVQYAKNCHNRGRNSEVTLR